MISVLHCVGRSNGFSAMSRNTEARSKFIKKLVKLCKQHGFDGVDYNWEYPGYSFGTGYAPDAEVQKDYDGLVSLLKETREAFGPDKIITLAYYPDKRQEQYLNMGDAELYSDFMHMMTYDQHGAQHSSMELATNSIKQAIAAGLPAPKITLGVPFYGRHSQTGDWITYEDLVQKHHPLSYVADTVPAPDGAVIGFNGMYTMAEKIKLALRNGIGGVMIWEVGQDCRTVPVLRSGKTHGITCPAGEKSSLLQVITDVINTYTEEGDLDNTARIQKTEL